MIAICNGSHFEELQRVAIRNASAANVELVWIYADLIEQQQLLRNRATNIVSIEEFILTWIDKVKVIALHNKIFTEGNSPPIENIPIFEYLLTKTNNNCVFLLYSRGKWALEMARRIRSVKEDYPSYAQRISFWGEDDNAGHLFDLLCDADRDQDQLAHYFWAIGETEYFLKNLKSRITHRDIDNLPPFSRRLLATYKRINPRAEIDGMSPEALITALKKFVDKNQF